MGNEIEYTILATSGLYEVYVHYKNLDETTKLQTFATEYEAEMYVQDRLHRVLEVKPSRDSVKQPSHYTRGSIECIDFIQDQKMNFSRGNAIKYIVRAGYKHPEKEIEDLRKAIQYIEFEIRYLEKEDKS